MKLVLSSVILASFLSSVILASLLVLIPVNAEAKTFDNGNYKFEFPNGCKNEQKENRFTSVDADLDCKGNASLRFETGEVITDRLSGDTDNGMIDTMYSVLEQTSDGFSEVERGTDKYMINNQTAPYLIATYDQEFSNAFGVTKTENWVTMVVIIKSGDNIIVQYENDEDHFDKDLPMVEKIFKSVEVLGNNGTEQE